MRTPYMPCFLSPLNSSLPPHLGSLVPTQQHVALAYETLVSLSDHRLPEGLTPAPDALICDFISLQFHASVFIVALS